MFSCPMHPEITSKLPGNCPKCGMALVSQSEPLSYTPLIIVIALIAVAAVAAGFARGGGVGEIILNFMAGYFLVFSGFKLLDLKGFAHSYAGYDLIASRWMNYGYIYPFVELALGLAYLTRYNLPLTHWVTLIVMAVSAVGIAKSLLKTRKFQCACLGTVIKLPLSWVTLVEDLAMALMALLSIL